MRSPDVTEVNAVRVRKLKSLADELGITRSQLALAWILRHKGISSTIIGATRPEHVVENVMAANRTLSADVLARIEAVLTTQTLLEAS